VVFANLYGRRPVKQRWLPVGVLGGVLFATNVLARWAVKLLTSDDEAKATQIGLVSLVVVAVVMAVAAYWWAREHPMLRVAGDLAVGAVLGCLLSLLIAPLLVGTTPVRDGVDFFIGQIWRYLALAAGGTVFGLLIVMALGQDHKSQSWKRHTERFGAKPKRVVRR
jgi:MFS family permease